MSNTPEKPIYTIRIKGKTAHLSIDGEIRKPAKAGEVCCVALIDEAISKGCINAEYFINTHGGNSFYANEIVNANAKFTGTVNAELGALCASAGTYIACSVSGKVRMPKNGNYMFHKPMGNPQGNYDEIMAAAKLLKNVEDNYAAVYSARTGKTLTEINEMWAHDYWMSAQEAKTLGFVDDIIGETVIDEVIIAMYETLATAPKVVATATIPQKENHNSKDMDIQVMAKAIGLSATATEAEVIAEISNLKKDNTQKYSIIADLEAKLKENTQAQVKALVDGAVNDNKITDGERATWTALAEKDLPGTTKALAGIRPYVSASSKVNNGGVEGADKHEGWTWEDYQEKDTKALEVMAKTNTEKYNALKADFAKRKRQEKA